MTVATPPKPAEARSAPPRARGREGPSEAWDRTDRPPTAAIACLLGIAATHAFEVESKLDSAPYVGVMFVGMMGAAIVLAILLASRRRLELVWPAATFLGASAIVAYLWSRAIGLPGIENHVGHWSDPLGSAALIFEATLVGLSVPALRRRALRLSTGATFLASGLVAGGLMLAGGSHGHGGGGGHHEGMDIDAATPAQQAEARRLMVATTANAQQRFPTFDAARAAGYDFAPRSFEQQKDLDYWHVTNRSYLKDTRDLDPRRPESLMYWKNEDGRPQLMAAVFRVPTRKANPALGGPIIQWHLHRNANRRLGKYKMTHLWMLPRLRDAYSMSMPTKRFQRRFEDLPDNGRGAGA